MSNHLELVLRPAAIADVPTLFHLIQALAEYEQLADAVTGTSETLATHLFGDRPYAEAVLAEISGEAVGFALFFPTYSTFLTQPSLYLEDLFVFSAYRGSGIGKALLIHVAQLAVSRGCGRLEWSVLTWNQLAIDFYQRMGATLENDWRTCRVAGAALTALARL